MTTPILRSACRAFSAVVLVAGLVASLRGEDQVQLARRTLREVMAKETVWIKVHAAEVLATYGEKKRVREVFMDELKAHGTEPQYRIGIWRTLALAAEDPAARQSWADRVAAVFVDRAATDRLHAVETLGKLGGPHTPAVVAAAEAWFRDVSEEDGAYILWVRWQAGQPAALRSLIGLLRSPAAASRSRAAYVLVRAGTTDAGALAELARAADAEPADSPSRPNLVGAAYRLQASAGRLGAWRRILEQMVDAGGPGVKYTALQALMPFYQPTDLARIQPLLQHEHGDVRTGAAWAILAANKETTAGR